MPSLVKRKDIARLSATELDKLVYAFYKLQVADPGHPGALNEDSFYVIAGYHGQPFRGGGYSKEEWWGGYCHHGNVLFPTWHRAYLRRLEEALINVSGFDDVAVPYWNEFDDTQGVPELFTRKTYTFQAGFNPKYGFNSGDITTKDGVITLQHNPLFSYKLQQGFFDNLKRLVTNKDKSETKVVDYSKGQDYETVRCPYSGLVGTPQDKKETKEHNSHIKEAEAPAKLNENVKAWLANESDDHVPGMSALYLWAVYTPNYTVFSNTTSAAKWNDDNYHREANWNNKFAVSLEKPHNGVHLAVGGYSLPDRDSTRPNYAGSNGDMGENDTASFDPIFFFHHCFIDLVFWMWQVTNGAEEELEIFEGYPGTSPIDNQGPTAFMPADSHLNMKTPLVPFKVNHDKYLTSEDVVNIKHLGYDYELHPVPVSGKDELTLSNLKEKAAEFNTAADKEASALPIVRFSGISRAQRPGSFVVCTVTDAGNGEEVVGVEPVFSRWHVPSCANCSNTLEVTGHHVLPRDLMVKSRKNAKLGDLPPKERHEVATDLAPKMKLKILENPRADLLERGRGQDKRQLNDLNPEEEPKRRKKERISIDPDPQIDVLKGMWTVGNRVLPLVH
ncbi:hypothetical protein EYZ11_011394 [Aspergillus tanneri]|uniref:tyrosinase n=1 Tax=Aspergillus tanneri TaxID=1220188 RepID=A0A4S3J2W4_9EURO|nr:uncharacterized protein ATNIH1004_005193 [Aspergillus tanneri]KAA8649292.1 hypothetical protein ATNIH1004_005193 [Aspergillus tanneri]THC89163.1 hypothetical protein EYZ11_011394 [Aspergillus tanneri]